MADSTGPVARHHPSWRHGCLLAAGLGIGLVTAVVLAPRWLPAEWIADERHEHVTQGQDWTAFVRRIDYRWIADTDTSIYLARSLGEAKSWVRLAPTDPPVV